MLLLTKVQNHYLHLDYLYRLYMVCALYVLVCSDHVISQVILTTKRISIQIVTKV